MILIINFLFYGTFKNRVSKVLWKWNNKTLEPNTRKSEMKLKHEGRTESKINKKNKDD